MKKGGNDTCKLCMHAICSWVAKSGVDDEADIVIFVEMVKTVDIVNLVW